MTGTGAPALSARIARRLRHFDLDVALECGPGRILALVGPSGSGKTSVLRCLAGLDALDHGDIRLGDETWNRGGRILRSPQERRVGMLAQDAPLFPHMTILDNVRFAMDRGADLSPLLDELGILHLRDHRPHEVSGGERQRAALCQVLGRRPRLLLLDEPFSALDVENRLALRERLRVIRDRWRIPILHVTHDLTDALTLADTVLSLRNGREDPQWLARQARLLGVEAGGHPLPGPTRGTPQPRDLFAA
jgi:molybdate transport system ATP-binding protein